MKYRIHLSVLSLLAVGVMTLAPGGCVYVTPTAATLQVGQTATLQATGVSDSAFTWSSDTTAVATVNQSGVVTAVSAGSAVITATGNTTQASASATITVQAPSAHVSVNPDHAGVVTGGTIALAATSTDALDTTFTWASSQTTVATVSASGVVTAIAPGVTNITATGSHSGAVGKGTSIITVTAPPPPLHVTINPGFARVLLGETQALVATSNDVLDTSFVWTSGNLGIATVDVSGVVTAVGEGSVLITATGSHSGAAAKGTATITVIRDPFPAVAVTPAAKTIDVGATVTLTATSNDTLDTSFAWFTSQASLATVSTSGVVTGVAPGTVVISAIGSHSGAGAKGSSTITVNAHVNQPPVANAGPDASVPYKASATLDGSGSTDPENAKLTYAWSQISGPTAKLSSATVAKPTFTPAQVGVYVFQLIVNDGQVDSAPDQVTITAVNTAPVAVISVDAISDADIAARGITTGKSSGLSNVGIGTAVYLLGSGTDANSDPIVSYSWAIASKPQGSAAALSSTTSQNPVFIPDLEGTYKVTLVVSDGAKLLSVAASRNINAGKYIGEGTDVGQSACSPCHNGKVAPDMITPWRGTKHATKFTRAIDGGSGAGYAARCLPCHTVGYDKSPLAVNDGFDDIATQLNWTLPQPIQPGNWTALVAQYPQLARRGNIQCENCHGPASQHVAGAALSSSVKMSATFNAGLCGQCHGQEAQWELAGHSDANAAAFNTPTGPTRTACARCHTGRGYIDFVNGVPEASRNTTKQVISCAICHDPHDATNERQLRLVDTVDLPGNVHLTGWGPSATCMACHNARTAPADALTNSFPHHSTAAEFLAGVNGITYGVNLKSSPHTLMGAGCVDCHMAPTPGTAHDNIHQPGEDVVGSHTFHVTAKTTDPTSPDYKFENVQNACNTTGCHDDSPITVVNRKAYGDYDGNGKIEGVQDEVKGLMAVLLDAIVKSGVTYSATARPAWGNITTDKQRNAIYNYGLAAIDGSYGIHNTGYLVGLLQLSYKDLTGNAVPNATLRY